MGRQKVHNPFHRQKLLVLQRHLPGIDLAPALARMDLSQRQKLSWNIARREEYEARADAFRAAHAVAMARMAEAERRRDAAEASRAEAHRRIAAQHANDQFPAGG